MGAAASNERGGKVRGRVSHKLKMPACLTAVALLVASWSSFADDRHLYVTWEGAEPDKGAAAWYIKRHLDPQAVFVVRPQGVLFDSGIVFDAPQGRYRRTQSTSTLESLLRDYPSSDPTIRRLGELMHDIEINIWMPKKHPESTVIESRLLAIDTAHGNHGLPIGCLIDFFDNIYAWLKVIPHPAEAIMTPGSCEAPDNPAHAAAK
jgi:hypothetical protein